MDREKPKWLKNIQPFIVGGLSGCIATTCIQPIDMVKVRIQLSGGGNPICVARGVIKSEGFKGLYKGLDAGLIRQLTYTTGRMGLFRVFSDMLKGESSTSLPLYQKALAGLAAGGLAAFMGNPADLSLVRMQSDATLPVAERRNYTGVFNALSRTIKEDGVLGLWRGSTPTILRAMSLNMGMLASYDESKEILEKKLNSKGWTPTLLASAISGFFAVTLSLPFDFVKTRMQKMTPDPITKQMPFKSFLHCSTHILKTEGALVFYAGYPTYYFRIAPHAMITLIAVDLLNSAINNKYK